MTLNKFNFMRKPAHSFTCLAGFKSSDNVTGSKPRFLNSGITKRKNSGVCSVGCIKIKSPPTLPKIFLTSSLRRELPINRVKYA